MSWPTDQVATGDLITAAQLNRLPILLADTLVAGSAVASVDLTSIPAHWTHLKLIVSGRSSTAALTDYVRFRFNNDSTAIYNWQNLSWINTTVGSGPAVSQTGIIGLIVAAASATANVAGGGEVLIANYAATTFHKTLEHSVASVSADDTATNQQLHLFGGRWRSTAAINRITLTLNSGANFEIGTRVTLYGMGRL